MSGDIMTASLTHDTCVLVYENGTTETLDAAGIAKMRRHADRIRGCYFLLNTATGLVKIGRSDDILHRWRSLETQSGTTLFPLMLWTTKKHGWLERKLHRHFAAHRQIGEWFNAAPVQEWIDSPPTPGYVCIPTMPKQPPSPINGLDF